MAALVGVDFDTGASAPNNWTSIGTSGTPLTQSNLVDEDGNATTFDLTINETGAGTATCGANEICSAAASINAASLPSHTQSLSGLDGQVFTDADPVSLTWSDLTPGTDYEVYVFGLEGFFGSIQQDVTVTGAGTPVTYTQNFTQNNLFINDEAGSNGRALSSYADLVTADANGEITIDIVPVNFTLDVSLGGVAIRELGAPELTLSIADESIGEDDGPAATIATVSRNSDTTNPLLVNLSSDDTSEATVPATVTIPAGETFVQFDIDAVDDVLFDQVQTATITATAAGHTDASDSVDVIDDDAVLTVDLFDDAVLETAGNGAVGLQLTSSTTGNLTVDLVSSSPKVVVPAQATLINGFAILSIDVVDNLIDDGSESVTITATATDYIDGNDSLIVIDDEFSANLSLDIAANSINESDGIAATTGVVSRGPLGPIDAFVNRGVSISDANGAESETDSTVGEYTKTFVRNDPGAVLDHEVSLVSQRR